MEGPIPAVPVGHATRDYPWLSTDVDLASAGFVEEEFFFSGTASRFATAGLPTPWIQGDPIVPPNDISDSGHWYRSRMLVRRPRDPSKFNGAVMVEWLNVSDSYDGEYDWYQLHDHILRGGYAWVGVSVQRAGIHAAPHGLRSWSPSRYESLDVTDGGTITDDTLAYDIFSQAAAAVRCPGGVKPLGSISSARGGAMPSLIATGHSQSAMRLTDYINCVHGLARVYDGFILHSLGGVIGADVDATVLRIDTQDDVLLRPHQADTDRVRTWEVVGTSHFDWRAQSGRGSVLTRDLGYLPNTATPGEAPRYSRLPFHTVFARAVDEVVSWIADGTPPAVVRPIAVDTSTYPYSVLLDEEGRVQGGIHLDR